MSTRDIASNVGVKESVRPAVQSASVSGEAVDLMGYESAVAIVNSGAIASSGNFTAKLQESDTTTDGDFDDVAASDMVGSFAAVMTANNVEKVGYIGDKQYIRVVLTRNSGTSIAAGAVVVLGHPHQRPVA
jgi:hypothetical protein